MPELSAVPLPPHDSRHCDVCAYRNGGRRPVQEYMYDSVVKKAREMLETGECRVSAGIGMRDVVVDGQIAREPDGSWTLVLHVPATADDD